ncbi:BsaWI family type II restriction enzyme [Flavobacterium sp. PL002]|uniref:BsaWI family type II restriction enzyme n=1 Tax=Flavobacterium sp. PL002 TaxID=1897058 RepID=UPI0017880A1F|nr:BsaWI family type II restriction enzyme [Flavobacterium sp. PL002]MBE0392557.1 hypothetical protein [Flavobacterium sp. PL002]
MLNNILGFKEEVIESCKNVDININEFINIIGQTQQTRNLLFDNQAYWKKYLHATLISAYQILTEYDLQRWNEYFNNISEIEIIFNISANNESDILELFVLHSINKVFNFKHNSLSIKAFRSNNNSNPTRLLCDNNKADTLTELENETIISNLKIGMKLRGLPKKEIWGDNDVIVTLRLNENLQQFCIISCKTSLRERVYQSIFWSMHSRLEGIGKHVFVTPDKGQNGNSEIGNRKDDNSAKKSRDVLESTMDRVYVLRNNAEVGRSQVIKDFMDLEKDLLNWANDIAGI